MKTTIPTKRAKVMSQRAAEEHLDALRTRVLRQTVKGNVPVAARLRRMAIRFGRRAVRKWPSSQLWVMLGDVYSSLRMSEVCYRAALSLDGDGTEAAYEVAKLAFHKHRNLREAEKLVDRFMKSLPPGIESLALSFAVEVYAVCGRREDAARARRRESYWRKQDPGGTMGELDPDWDKPDPIE